MLPISERLFSYTYLIVNWVIQNLFLHSFTNCIIYSRYKSEISLIIDSWKSFSPFWCVFLCVESSLMWKKLHKIFKHWQIEYLLVLERTVRCLWTVQFFVMFDMFEVRFWVKMWCSEVFEVWSCFYETRLVLEHTVWCLRTVRVFVMFDMFEVRFWAKMWCSESSVFGHSMFEVRYFGVRSKTSTCLFDFLQTAWQKPAWA